MLFSCCVFGLWFCSYCLVVRLFAVVVGWWAYCLSVLSLKGIVLVGLLVLLLCYLVGLLGLLCLYFGIWFGGIVLLLRIG